MKRARFAFAATIAGVIAASGLTIAAQGQPAPAAPKAPEFKNVLAGKKFTPPIRGQATIDIVRTPTQRVGTTLVTKIQVRNTSAATTSTRISEKRRPSGSPSRWYAGSSQPKFG